MDKKTLELQNEAVKLRFALNEFKGHMQDRLLDKMEEGRTGWDTSLLNAGDMPQLMFNKALAICVDVRCERDEDIMAKDLIDIANYAMFLHWRTTHAKR